MKTHKMNQTIQHFLDQIRKGQYKAAAQIYSNRAYQYKAEFDEILDKCFRDPYYNDVKEVVLLELENLERND